MKTERINFKEFLSGEYEKPKVELMKFLSGSAPALIMIVPKTALAAAAGGTFGNLHGAIMNGFDSGVVLVIIFAGAAWSLGHRSKALEILIGVCCGYVLARHATDIRDFLKGI
jgi:hypothetical protein